MANIKRIFHKVKVHLNDNNNLPKILNDASCEQWLCCESLIAIDSILSAREYVCLEDQKRDISIYKIQEKDDSLTHAIEVKLVYSNNFKDADNDIRKLKDQINKPTEDTTSAVGLVFFIWKYCGDSNKMTSELRIFKTKCRSLLQKHFNTNTYTSQSGFYLTEILQPKLVKTPWVNGGERWVALYADYFVLSKWPK